ncbi:rCG40036, isoform CRA_e, partial [Rattus norvegicus]
MIPLVYFVLPTLGSYVILSIFFLRRPHLLHTPWAPGFSIRLAAHRGGSGERLENTMEAIENSMAQRADLLEFDCQLTRDGVVVVSHDKNLSRQSGLNKDINTLDFAQLPLYKEELEIYFSPGRMCVSLHCLAAFSYTLIKPLPLARLSHSDPSFCDTPPR